MDPRTVWSSKTYGLLADGSIQFPAAPAGNVVITLVNGAMPDGSFITGTFRGVLGLGPLTIHAPAEPSLGLSRVHVTTPSGLPLAWASVSVTGVTSSVSASGSSFSAPQAVTSGTTDANGDFSVIGFPSDSSKATVSYDDGVVTQQQVVDLVSPLTTVKMTYDPEVIASVTSAEAKSGDLITETLIVQGPASQHPGNKSRASTTKAGIAVQAVLPKGYGVGTCGAVLHAVTNAKGKATLKLCASSTGVVRFTASGAYVVGALKVYVKGSTATAVRSLHATTPSTGALKISWTLPEYSGGKPITGYDLKLTAAGHPTVTAHSSTTSIKLKGLANATRYKVSVTPVTSKGTGASASITAGVA
jgi:hypothetical protein